MSYSISSCYGRFVRVGVGVGTAVYVLVSNQNQHALLVLLLVWVGFLRAQSKQVDLCLCCLPGVKLILAAAAVLLVS